MWCSFWCLGPTNDCIMLFYQKYSWNCILCRGINCFSTCMIAENASNYTYQARNCSLGNKTWYPMNQHSIDVLLINQSRTNIAAITCLKQILLLFWCCLFFSLISVNHCLISDSLSFLQLLWELWLLLSPRSSSFISINMGFCQQAHLHDRSIIW